MTACDEIRIELGAYALGALEPDEEQRVDAHLDECDTCRHELAQLSLASSLLRRPVARAFATESEPDPTLVEQALARVASDRSAQTDKLRRLGAAAGATGVALLAVIAVAVTLARRPTDSFSPSGPETAMHASVGSDAAASVRLSARPWGTQVDLHAERLPALQPGSYYEVWLVRPDGTRVAAGTFRPTAPVGQARVRLAAGIPRPSVARIGVTLEGAGPGRRLLDATA